MHVRTFINFKEFHQQDLAAAAGLNPFRFSRICQGRSSLPAQAVQPIADKLGLDPLTVLNAFTEVRNQYERREAT